MGILVSWAMTPPLTWLFAYHYGMGAVGGWVALCLDIFVGTAVFWWRVQGTRWHAAADRAMQDI
jgi:Na+-driven multidrug efflux pump